MSSPDPINAYQHPEASSVRLILVADDNEHHLKMMKRMIESQGYDCVTTNSPTTALRIAEEKHPALFFCDINFGIGKNSGISIVSSLKEKGIELPVVIVSAFIHRGAREQAEQAGVVDYISKPIEPEQIATLIRKILSRRQP